MSAVQKLNPKYFNDTLSKEVLDLIVPLDNERDEAHRFLDRMGRSKQLYGDEQ